MRRLVIPVMIVFLMLGSNAILYSQGKQSPFPNPDDLISVKDDTRKKAIVQFAVAKSNLEKWLSNIVDKKYYKNYSMLHRSHTCYLLHELRPTSPDVIKSLISVVEIDHEFDPINKDIAKDEKTPQSALRSIGVPAFEYIIEAVKETDDKRRQLYLIGSMSVFRDFKDNYEFLNYYLPKQIEKEKDVVKKERLKKAYKHFQKVNEKLYKDARK